MRWARPRSRSSPKRITSPSIASRRTSPTASARGGAPSPPTWRWTTFIRVAVETESDAIHPGYGFLSESPEFAEACAEAGIAFIGPRPETLRLLGDKVSARAIAARAGVPTVPATDALPAETAEALALVRAVGFPGMLKASWGGGGRGMRIVETEDEFEAALLAARREADAAFGQGRYLPRAFHPPRPPP